MSLDERAFFSDKNEQRSERLSCPRCRRTNDYSVRWVRRKKKDRLPPGADERDRAKFAKLRDHLIRVDDEVVCKTCGKKFEIPSLHSLLFVDQLEGLPRDVEDDGDAQPAAEPASRPEAPSAARPAGHDRGSPDRSTQERGGHDRASHDRSRGPRRMNSPSRGWR